jgi:hypothetical protein
MFDNSFLVLGVNELFLPVNDMKVSFVTLLCTRIDMYRI